MVKTTQKRIRRVGNFGTVRGKKSKNKKKPKKTRWRGKGWGSIFATTRTRGEIKHGLKKG